MKKILLLLFLPLLLLTGCTKQVEPTYSKADMSGYVGFDDEDHVYYEMDVSDFLQALDQKQSMIFYFGFSDCPWCIEAVPILNDVAKENQVHVGYIDTRKDPNVTSNIEIEDYDQLIEAVGEYFEYDSDGIRHLYTPFFFFVKDGKVIETHQGTVPGHDAHERKMTEQEQQQFYNYLNQTIQSIK